MMSTLRGEGGPAVAKEVGVLSKGGCVVKMLTWGGSEILWMS